MQEQVYLEMDTQLDYPFKKDDIIRLCYQGLLLKFTIIEITNKKELILYYNFLYYIATWDLDECVWKIVKCLEARP